MDAKTFRLPRLPVDGYVLLIVLCAATAAVIPARGIVAEGLDQGIKWVIALLFFLYGARLSPQRQTQGPRATMSAWRRSEEHTSELQSLMRISYAVFCLKKKKNTKNLITMLQAI